MPKHLDIFSGMGALSLGWEKAGSTAVLGVDIVEHAAHTYALNRPDTPALLHDVAKVNPAEVRAVIGPVDYITGGVPCEPFSMARGGDPNKKDDPRKFLIKAAMRWVEAFQPKAFVFENVVPAVKSEQWQKAIKAIQRKGYGVSVWKLIASDYGVPQKRRRVFLVGVKGTEPESLTPPEPTGTKTAKQAFSDLGEPKEDHKDPLHRPRSPIPERAMRAVAKAKPGDQLKDHGYPGWSNYVLHPDKPSRMVITGGILVHWNKKRQLTLRELARLQSLPDSYKFDVPNHKIREMLGDVVPVGLAHAVAKKVLSYTTKASDVPVDPSLFSDLADCLVPLPFQSEMKQAAASDEAAFEWLADMRMADTPEDFERESAASKREDAVEPGRAFWQPKPTRAAGPEEYQSVERFVGMYRERPEWLPTVVQKKYDGARHQVHVADGKVLIMSEDGQDNTARLPSVVEELKKLGKASLVFDTEIEAWEGRKHLPREAVAAYLHSKDGVDDSGIVVNVFDALYLDKDLHSEKLGKRLELLGSLPFRQSTMGVPDTSIKLNHAPGVMVTDYPELERAVRRMRRLPGSEGVVSKRLDSVYPLDHITPDTWVKYHNATQLRVIVIGKERTEGGAWIYQYGIVPGKGKVVETIDVDGRTLLPMGDTFSTSQSFEPGDSVAIEAETLNLLRGPDGLDLTAWVPRVIGAWAGKPDTVDEAVDRAAKNLVLQEKEIDAEGNVVYKGESVEMQADPYLEVPKEGPRYRYVVQQHWRGKSMHADFRLEKDTDKKMLLGWTLNTLKAGAVKEPVTTLQQARALDMKEVSKVNWSTGEWDKKEKPGAKDLVTVEILSEPKAPEPWPWLDVEGRTRDPEPGKAPPVGGTAQYPGVFQIVDQGVVEYGAQKPWFHEYFVRGKGMNYRLMFRQLNLGPMQKALGKYEDGSHVCAVIPLPDRLAKQFPKGKDMEPHVTSGYFGDMPKEKVGAFMRALIDTADATKPFKAKLAGEVSYFKPSKSSEGKKVAKVAVLSEGLEDFHGRLKKRAKALGLDVDKSWPKYDPHATIGYIGADEEWDGDVPSGEWDVDCVEVWGFKERFDLPFGREVLKAVESIAKTVEPPSEGEGAPYGGTQWYAIKPDDPTPYVLSRDAVEKGWMPPIGVSALPGSIREKIPKEYRYWERRSHAQQMRDALVDALDKGEVKLDYSSTYKSLRKASATDAEFVLQEQSWKGPIQIRTGPSRRLWRLLLDVGQPELVMVRMYQNPIDNKELAAEVDTEPHKDALDVEGDVPPGHYLNETKETPSQVEVLDGGKASVLTMSEDSIKLRIEGKHIKGLFQLTRNNGEWLWQPSSPAPSVEKSMGEGLPAALLGKSVRLCKADKRLVTGIVLEPNEVDAHGDFERESIIEKAAHEFLALYNKATKLGIQHTMFGDVGVDLVESWIAPVDLNLNGHGIKKGTWIMTMKVHNDETWRKVKAGKITGLSIGGVATV